VTRETADKKCVGYLTDVRARFFSTIWVVSTGAVTEGAHKGYEVMPGFAAAIREHEQAHVAAARALFDVLAPQYVAIASKLESAPKETGEEAVKAIDTMYYSLADQLVKLWQRYTSKFDKEIDKQGWIPWEGTKEYVMVGRRGDWGAVLKRDAPKVSAPTQV
jgi:hypothetical protein